MLFSRMCNEGFPFISWGPGRWRCVRWTWLRRLQPFAAVRGVADALLLGKACKRLFMAWRSVILCRYSIVKYKHMVCRVRKVMHFTAQPQGFAKVTRLCRYSIRNCRFTGVLEVSNRALPLGWRKERKRLKHGTEDLGRWWGGVQFWYLGFAEEKIALPQLDRGLGNATRFF